VTVTTCREESALTVPKARIPPILPGRSGFTLNELLLVVVLISIIGAFSFPHFADFRLSNELRNATIKLQADIRLSQRVAAARHMQRIVVIRDSSYEILDDLDRDRTRDDGERHQTLSLPNSISFASVSLTPPDSIIIVPAGTLAEPGHGGTLSLVTVKGEKRRLRIWSTGTVQMVNEMDED
jgi:prepilin-type N-terminal cleavage/methylation domain-containing protein